MGTRVQLGQDWWQVYALPPSWSPSSPTSSKSSPISSSSSQQRHIHHHGQLGDKFMCFPAPTTAKDWELEGKRLVWKNIQLLTFMNTLSAVVQQDPFESPRKRMVNDVNHRKLRRPAFYKNSVYQKTSEFPPWRRYPTRDASQAETVRGNALMCLWLSPRRPQATGISYFLDCIVLYFCISVLYLWSCLRWAGGTGKSYLLCIVEPDLWGHGIIVDWWAAQEISNCLWLSTIPTISQTIPTIISQIIIIFKTSSAFSLPVALVDFFIVRVVNRIKYWALGRLQKFINNCHRILFLGWTIVKKKYQLLLP